MSLFWFGTSLMGLWKPQFWQCQLHSCLKFSFDLNQVSYAFSQKEVLRSFKYLKTLASNLTNFTSKHLPLTFNSVKPHFTCFLWELSTWDLVTSKSMTWTYLKDFSWQFQHFKASATAISSTELNSFKSSKYLTLTNLNFLLKTFDSYSD